MESATKSNNISVCVLINLRFYYSHLTYRYRVHSRWLVFEQKHHPQALQPFLPEIYAFAEHNHFKVLHPILRYIDSRIYYEFGLISEQATRSRHGAT